MKAAKQRSVKRAIRATKTTHRKRTSVPRGPLQRTKAITRQAGWIRANFSWQYAITACFILIFAVIGAWLLSLSHAEAAYGSIGGVGSKCLDNLGGKKADFNTIDLWQCNATIAQQWRYNANRSITNADGYCLDVYHSGMRDGTQVDLFNCNGTVAQQWVVEPGAGTITNPHSGMCLDDKLADTHDGNPIQIWSCLGNKQQQWSVSTGAVMPHRATGAITAGAGVDSSQCEKATGPFTVDRTNIIDGNGDVFESYGATLSTPQLYTATNVSKDITGTLLSETEAQIKAIADGWCGNTVRLQIEQDGLVGTNGKSLNSGYLDYIKTIVSYAERQGLAVALNDQTEPAGNATTLNEPLPTEATEAFWHQMNMLYSHDPQVIYDLFNEPRPGDFYATTPTEQTVWNDTLEGGRFTYTYNKTYSDTYVGMQALADYVRRDGATNLYWIEPGGLLDGIAQHPDTYLIKGDGPIAYEFHHTTTDGTPRTVANWDAEFGDVVKEDIAPVVDGEWTNYSNYSGWRAPNGDSTQCWADAPTTVPQYLEYLQNLGIGMTVWTLSKGTMVSPNAPDNNYTMPTTFQSNWSCNKGLDEGAGQLVQNWYFRQN